MARIVIGPSSGRSTTSIELTLSATSTLDLQIGESRDFSALQIKLMEADSNALLDEVQRIRQQLKELASANPSLAREANGLAATVEKTISERRWYSVSAKGVLEAAKAVGEAANPIVSSCIKVIELLGKVKLS